MIKIGRERRQRWRVPDRSGERVPKSNRTDKEGMSICISSSIGDKEVVVTPSLVEGQREMVSRNVDKSVITSDRTM